jgi:glutathione-specific gamma-glutamylcyclotransferase
MSEGSTPRRSNRRQLSLTSELVARCFREVDNPGPNTAYTPVSEDERTALVDCLLAAPPDGPFWIFAYGSLIWKPTFAATQVKRGSALGWHRSFCIELTRWRGTPEHPGLMMALAPGGQCNGLLLEVPPDRVREVVAELVTREITLREDLGMARWIQIRTADGVVRAITFWAGPKGDGFSHGLSLETIAHRIAHACGHAGSNADYLYQTVSKLEEHGIRDRNLWRLQQLVAAEIGRW